MGHAKRRVVEADRPADTIEIGSMGFEFLQNIEIRDKAVHPRPDASVAPGLGAEVDSTVFREINLAAGGVRTKELAGVIARGDGYCIQPGISKP